MFTYAQLVAEHILHLGKLRGIAYGTQLQNLRIGYGVTTVTMLAWERLDRRNYQLRT